MTEKDIEKAMISLDLTREEAIEMLKEDEEIDRMTPTEAYSDLTEEQRKAVKSATITGSKKRVPVKRERKVDTDKLAIMNALNNLLYNHISNIQITGRKNESEISFSLGENSYTLKLIKHRPPKK